MIRRTTAKQAVLTVDCPRCGEEMKLNVDVDNITKSCAHCSHCNITYSGLADMTPTVWLALPEEWN